MDVPGVLSPRDSSRTGTPSLGSFGTRSRSAGCEGDDRAPAPRRQLCCPTNNRVCRLATQDSWWASTPLLSNSSPPSRTSDRKGTKIGAHPPLAATSHLSSLGELSPTQQLVCHNLPHPPWASACQWRMGTNLYTQFYQQTSRQKHRLPPQPHPWTACLPRPGIPRREFFAGVVLIPHNTLFVSALAFWRCWVPSPLGSNYRRKRTAS